MKLSRNAKLFSLALTALLVSACGKDDPAETVMPTEKSTCGGEALPNEYLLQWTDGSITIEKQISRENLKENIVRKNLNRLVRVEYNQKFKVQEFIRHETSASDSIDNWGYERVGAAKYWAQGVRGQGVVVAVVDTGVDTQHPILKNNIYHNANEISGNGIDDDNNGFIDDVTGFNFVSNSGEMLDDVGHGTHVSGIVAGEHSETEVTNNKSLGMAPAAKILPVRFLSRAGGTLNDAISAIEYAKNNGAHIINASWGGGGCSQILADKIAELQEKNILFVAAAGNAGLSIERFPEYPAAFTLPHQITVGSISPFDGMSSFSNYSTKLVHIFAPGFEIYSAVPGGGMSAQSGTSMATPFVTGAAALLKSLELQKSVGDLKTEVLNAIVQDDDYLNLTRGRLSL